MSKLIGLDLVLGLSDICSLLLELQMNFFKKVPPNVTVEEMFQF